MVVLAWVLKNRQLVAELSCTAGLVFLIYWFGFHIPAELKIAKEQAKAGQEAVELLNKVTKSREAIDAATQKQISSIRSRVLAPHTVLIPVGVLR